MSLRGLRTVALIAALAAGAILPPALLIGDASRMLVTFLGLVAASILPTVSLVIGSLSSTGRSVQKIDELFHELSRAVRMLFSILGCIAMAVMLLAMIAILPDIPWTIPWGAITVPDAARRGLQALALLCAAAAAVEAVIIPRILMRILAIKRDIAVYEARKALTDAAPREADIRQIFTTKDGFGSSVPVERVRP